MSENYKCWKIWANLLRVKQQYFFAILLFAYIFIIIAVVIVFKIGYRLAEKEMRSAAMPSRNVSNTNGKNGKDQKKFKVWFKRRSVSMLSALLCVRGPSGYQPTRTVWWSIIQSFWITCRKLVLTRRFVVDEHIQVKADLYSRHFWL